MKKLSLIALIMVVFFSFTGVEAKTEGDVQYLSSFEQDDYIKIKDVDLTPRKTEKANKKGTN